MKAAVVSHGEVRDYPYTASIIKDCDLIVCADGGVEHVLKCGMVPNAVVGDLDSVSSNAIQEVYHKKIDIVKYPRDKDYTDTQLAINYAIEKGASEILLIGSVGDRIDHSLANIFLMIKLEKANIKCCLLNEKNAIYITGKEIKLRAKIGDIVSLIPVGGDAKGVYTEGLQYKLSGRDLEMGEPLGISNIVTEEEFTVRVTSGFLLVIMSRD